MSNSIGLRVFLLLYSIVGVLTDGDRECGTPFPSTWQQKTCGNVSYSFNTTKFNGMNGYYIQVPQSAPPNWCVTEQFIDCDRSCTYCIQLSTKVNGTCQGENSRACECHRDSSYNGYTANSTEETPTESGSTALIALVCVLALLLALVTTCWTCTYWKMKKRIRELQTTSANNNSLTTEDAIQTQQCFQNVSYQRNSTSHPQSLSPDGAIYDLPFQTPAAALKNEQNSDTEVRDRHDSNRYKTVEDNISQAHIVPQIPRANGIEHSGDELQMVCEVTEYEVPIPLKGTKLSLHDST